MIGYVFCQNNVFQIVMVCHPVTCKLSRAAGIYLEMATVERADQACAPLLCHLLAG